MVPDPADDRAGHDDLDDLFGAPGDKPRGGGQGRRPARARLLRGSERRHRSADEVDDELDGPPSSDDDGRRRVYWRARDSLWFEPLVALAIIVVLLVSLFAYTSNWPPVYVVESNSMQHGAGDHVGYLNAGDVVLAQKVPTSQIVTYYAAKHSGSPSNYGELGDVILYYPNGATSATPVVHRALLYLEYDRTNQSYNATQLSGLPCGGNPAVDDYDVSSGCGRTVGLTGSLTLFHVGWKNITFALNFADPSCRAAWGARSGFVTLGDNNSYPDQASTACGAGNPISAMVDPSWVIGIAQGLLPWFGAIKLFLDGNSQLVPGGSWEYMGLSIAGLLLGAAGLHFLLRRLGVRSEMRRREEQRRERAEARDEERDGRPPMRSWDEPDDRPPPEAARSTHEDRRRSHFTTQARARRPHDRPPKDARAEPTDGDDD